MNNTTKILGVVILIAFVFAFISIPFRIGGDYYGFINWVVPALVLIFMSIILFSTNTYKNIFAGDNVFKKVMIVIGNLLLIALTTFVSWIVLAFIGFSNGSYTL